jgi:hypothetical protein
MPPFLGPGREPTEIAHDTRRCREMTKPAGPASKIRQPLNMSPASLMRPRKNSLVC